MSTRARDERGKKVDRKKVCMPCHARIKNATTNVKNTSPPHQKTPKIRSAPLYSHEEREKQINPTPSNQPVTKTQKCIENNIQSTRGESSSLKEKNIPKYQTSFNYQSSTWLGVCLFRLQNARRSRLLLLGTFLDDADPDMSLPYVLSWPEPTRTTLEP